MGEKKPRTGSRLRPGLLEEVGEAFRVAAAAVGSDEAERIGRLRDEVVGLLETVETRTVAALAARDVARLRSEGRCVQCATKVGDDVLARAPKAPRCDDCVRHNQEVKKARRALIGCSCWAEKVHSKHCPLAGKPVVLPPRDDGTWRASARERRLRGLGEGEANMLGKDILITAAGACEGWAPYSATLMREVARRVDVDIPPRIAASLVRAATAPNTHRLPSELLAKMPEPHVEGILYGDVERTVASVLDHAKGAAR